MDEHVTRWIGPYLDGELGKEVQAKVETHLASCPTCRQDLEYTRQLSLWLHSVPLPAGLPSAAGFAAQLQIRLPARAVKRAAAPRWTTPGLAWWLIPLAILSGWLVFQTAVLLPQLGWVLAPLGLSNTALAWLAPNFYLSGWLSLAGSSLQQVLGAFVPLVWIDFAAQWQVLLLQLGVDALAALLFMSWLAGLAARRIHLARLPASSLQATIERKV